MVVDIIKVSTDDYEVIYINGSQKFDGHSVDLDVTLDGLVGSTINSFESYYIDAEVMEEKYEWSFPSNFNGFDKEDLLQ